jgi:hypothetical protein
MNPQLPASLSSNQLSNDGSDKNASVQVAAFGAAADLAFGFELLTFLINGHFPVMKRRLFCHSG